MGFLSLSSTNDTYMVLCSKNFIIFSFFVSLCLKVCGIKTLAARPKVVRWGLHGAHHTEASLD